MVLEQAGQPGRIVGHDLLGTGVRGVLVANSAAMAIAYLAIRRRSPDQGIPNPLERSHVMRETCQAAVFFAGQMLINNSGIVLVNHFFLGTGGGLVCGRRHGGPRDLLVVAGCGELNLPSGRRHTRGGAKGSASHCHIAVMVMGDRRHDFAGAVLRACSNCGRTCSARGSRFGGKYSISYLLALYALATVIYSLGAVIITFEMSYKIANTSWVQLAFSGVLIPGICLFHSACAK